MARGQKSSLPVDPKLAVDHILEKYENGQTMYQIAKDLKISHQAIYSRLLRTDPERWKERQAAQTLADLESAQERLQVAQTMVEVSKNRELAAIQRWKLERLLPAIFGQQSDKPQSPIQINIGIQRNGDNGLTLEAKPLEQSPDSLETPSQGLAPSRAQP